MEQGLAEPFLAGAPQLFTLLEVLDYFSKDGPMSWGSTPMLQPSELLVEDAYHLLLTRIFCKLTLICGGENPYNFNINIYF